MARMRFWEKRAIAGERYFYYNKEKSSAQRAEEEKEEGGSGLESTHNCGAQYELTEAVDFYIGAHLPALAAEADEVLNLQDSAEKLISFLTDSATLCTPGFVLRRHLAACGFLSREEMEECFLDENQPWPDRVTQRVARQLHRAGVKRHGLEIPAKNWAKYLRDDMVQGLHRNMVFKLSFVAGMNREATLRLLLACSQGSYNFRDPMELICCYCQSRPGVYTWRDTESLLERFQAGETPGVPPAEPPSPGQTARMLRGVEDILGGNLPQALAEERLIRLMERNRDEFAGFSLTARRAYLALVRYLYPLYPKVQAEGRGGPAKPVERSPQGDPVLRQQIAACVQTRFSALDDVAQTAAGEKRMVYTQKDGGRAFYPAALGKIALFCKHYYYRASDLQRGAEDVDRRDVLLLGYFLIGGACGAGPEGEAALAALAERDDVLGQAMGYVLADLHFLSRSPDIQDRFLLIRRVLGELLAAFGMKTPLYPPCAFDRFILLCALKSTQPPDSWQEVK